MQEKKNYDLLSLLNLANQFDLKLNYLMEDHFINTVPRDIIIRNITSIQKQIKNL